MSVYSKRIFPLLVLLFLSACAGFSLTNNNELTPIKSQSDAKQYRYLTLDNGLKVLLIEDQQAEKSAASLDVFVGSGQNPEHRPGLAHFLEHMLFLGTKKYPNAGAYQQFISENGGSHNAYTSFEHTNYFFDIKLDAFEQGLDHFSQFFISPLLQEKYLDREKHAVNAEYKAGIKNEERRQLDVLREVVNPKHPFSRFSVGNLASLSSTKTNIRDELQAFYQQYYVASNMSLVVLAPSSLDELEAMVRSKFSAIRDAKTPVISYAAPLLTKENLGRWVSIQPEQNRRSLSLLFPMPDQRKFYRDQPLNLIGHILGHEGEGSLFSYLKKQHWAKSLVAGQGLSIEGVTLFSLSIELTEQGEAHKDKVLDAVFSSINRLKQEGVSPWVMDELRQMAEIEFAYQDRRGESSTVMGLSNALHYYPVKDVLRSPYLYEKYNKSTIDDLLVRLSPDNMLLLYVSPEAKVDRRSSYYSVPYRVQPLSSERLQHFANLQAIPEITAPKPNAFIADSMALVESADPSALPIEIQSTTRVSAWFKSLDRFQQPKLEMSHHFYQPLGQVGVQQSLVLSLYARLLNDTQNEFLYDANMAGVYAKVSPMQQGLNIHSHGFSEKQPDLVKSLLQRYQQARFDEKQFARIKTALLVDLLNSQKQAPYRLLMGRWKSLMQKESWAVQERIEALQTIELSDVERFAQGFWKNVYLESLYNGNLSLEQAEMLLSQLQVIVPAIVDKETEKTKTEDSVKAMQPARAQVHVAALPEQNSSLEVPIDHADSAYLMYWQAQSDDAKTTALWLLLSNVLEAGYYHQLRTQEQLGYIVFESYYPLWRVPGLMFVVQSPEVGPQRIHQSTELFLSSTMSRLGLMSESQLSVYQASLLSSILQQPKNLAEESQYFQRSLFYRHFENSEALFKRREVLADALKSITPEDWQQFIASLTSKASDGSSDGFRHRLILHTTLAQKPEQADQSLNQFIPLSNKDALFKKSFAYP